MRLFAVIVQAVPAMLTLAALGYYVAAMLAARKYARELRTRRKPDEPAAMPVSILKPLRGFDPGMYQAFRSHCAQRYAGRYEILFGVSDPSDPAVEAVHRLQSEFPGIDIRLIECPLSLGPNGKVSTLAQMAPHARYDFLLVNDSDILVPQEYLQHGMNEFLAPETGMVTALYRGQTVPDARGRLTLWSRCESLTLSTDFIPGVVLARRIEGQVEFALGATLAIRREVLDKIGGFTPLAGYLADDYELGLRTVAAGYKVALTRDVVTTAVPPYRWRGFVSHQLRWLRTVRDARPAGYFGVCFTFGIMWALFTVIASAAAPWSLALFSLTLVARYGLALSVGVGLAGDTQVLRDAWLIPLRDLISSGLWLASFAGDTVEWRGLKFRLRKGKLERI